MTIVFGRQKSGITVIAEPIVNLEQTNSVAMAQMSERTLNIHDHVFDLVSSHSILHNQ
jgi:hypothetical protein